MITLRFTVGTLSGGVRHWCITGDDEELLADRIRGMSATSVEVIGMATRPEDLTLLQKLLPIVRECLAFLDPANCHDIVHEFVTAEPVGATACDAETADS